MLKVLTLESKFKQLFTWLFFFSWNHSLVKNFEQTENTNQKDKSHFTDVAGAWAENEIKRIEPNLISFCRRKTKNYCCFSCNIHSICFAIAACQDPFGTDCKALSSGREMFLAATDLILEVEFESSLLLPSNSALLFLCCHWFEIQNLRFEHHSSTQLWYSNISLKSIENSVSCCWQNTSQQWGPKFSHPWNSEWHWSHLL